MLFIKPECTEGMYGADCFRQCVGHCRGGTSCNHETGQCDGGCAAGWAGSLCEKGKNASVYLVFVFY